MTPTISTPTISTRDASSPDASSRPTVAILDAAALGRLAGMPIGGGAASAQTATQIRKLLAGVADARATLVDPPASPDGARAIDHLVVADVAAETLALAARAIDRPLLGLHSWVGHDGIWSELIDVAPDGTRRRLIGSASMVRAHRPSRSLAVARKRSSDFVRRWFARLPDALPAQAAGDAPPAPLNAGGLMMRTGRAATAKLFERLRRKQQWILFADRPPHPLAPIDFARGTPILPPPGAFWADPFPVVVDGRCHVFFEELPFATNRGHISVLELLPDGRTTPPVRVLERPYHLSYPFMFTWQGQWYMMPECSENRCIEVYRCERWPDRWTLHSQQLQGQCLADPSLVEHGGQWWMFASRRDQGITLDEELCLFHGPTPLGPWTEHPDNPVVDDARWARPAGRPLVIDGKLFRPAQNCGRVYGESLSIREIIELDTEHYREREHVHLRGDSRHGMLRVHTLNMAADLRVIDAMRLI
ncbi:MAG: hypothetical protein QM674_11010 [Burkholderiaceae bacterium]